MAEEPKLNSADESLLNSAKTGEGLVSLTPELMQSIGDNLRKRDEYIKKNYPRLVEDCDYETKLAVVSWVFGHIVDHATEGGSFRYLIYDRLGFGPDAYVPLYNAGGMTISNEFELKNGEET
jgi:hypothetical protein